MRFIAHRGVVTSAGALLAALVLTAPAAANTVTYNKHEAIELPGDVDGMSKAKVLSTMSVTGQEGPITDVDLTVRDVDMRYLGGLHLLLVSPSGESEVAESYMCSDEFVSNRTLTFDQSAGAGMQFGQPCPEGTYAPSDGSPDDPGPFASEPGGPTYTHNFDNFKNENASGTWSLYVYKTCFSCENSDQIGDGWGLKITTGDNVDLDVPAGNATSGVAGPFPSTLAVSGKDGLITDLDVSISGIFHTYPDDIDMMLEGPQGQRVMLMSDACGGSDANAYGWTWNDETAGFMPDEPANGCTASSYHPTNYPPLENLPTPAPAGPYSARLSDFDLTEPNGQWKLWVADDHLGDEGFFTNRFELKMTTRPRASVAFAGASREIAEGETGELTLTRSGASSYTDGSIEVSSTAGTASSGSDYTPVSQTVDFAPGQTEKTVPVSVLADDATEGAETFTVSLGAASGDARPGSPTTVEVTIPANGKAAASAFGTDTLVTLALARKQIPGRGPVPVAIRNRNPFEVTGKLSGRSAKRLGIAKKRIKLKGKAFSLDAGERKTVAIKLPKKLRHLLRQNGRVGLRMAAKVADPAGNRRTVRRKLRPKLLVNNTRR